VPLDRIAHYAKSELIHIDLPTPGEWVRVKPAWGPRDEKLKSRNLFHGQTVATSNVGAALETLDVGTLATFAPYAQMVVAIQEWSFDAPITMEEIIGLDDASRDCITAELDRLYPKPRTDDEAGNSEGSGAPLSLTAATTRKSSAG
jgi:hypothetical protein